MRKLLNLVASVLLACLVPFSTIAEEAEVTLKIGDILSIELPGEAAFNKPFQIDRKGMVQLPEVGGVLVRDRTLAVASEAIRNALGRAFRDIDKLTVALKEQKLLISVHGYVKNPGNVELAADATVQMAIFAAGGLMQGAQLDKIQVKKPGGSTIEVDYKKYLDTGDMSLLPRLEPLDVIFVPASPLTGKVQIDFDGKTLAAAGDGGEDRTSIKVFGEVNTPAIFAWKQGVTVIDMIMRAGGISHLAAPDKIRIINKGAPVVFNLASYLDSGDQKLLPEIEPGATIFVPKQVEEIRRGALTVYVMGEVAKPGAFETTNGASFIDILANAGGPTRFADTRRIRIIKSNGKVEMFDLPNYTEGESGKPPTIGVGDAIFVPEKTDAQEPSWLKIPSSRAVQVMGALYKLGRYEWSDAMSLFDLLAQAGGPTERADISSIEILRNENDRVRPIRFNLETYLKGGGSLKDIPKIHAGYIIMVPELPKDFNDNKVQWMRQAPDRSIYVMGQVGVPGRYAFTDRLGFLDIITAANGPTGSADLRNIRVSHRGREGARVTNVNLSLYLQTGDEKLLPRVKPGDVIYVPDKNKDYLDQPASRTVRVLGAISKPGRYQFSDDMSLLDLLAEAGGPTTDALQDRILVVNLSGGQSQARAFDLLGFAKTGDITRLPVVRAGDVVYIPNKSQDEWRQLREEARDIVQAASLISIISALGLR